MRINERMKRALSILLCVMMLVQYVPTHAFAATTDNLCEHHTEHTAECGYREGSAGSACTHEHSEDCYAILECLHTCGEECADGCNHECTVDNGCITMELDCHHVHGDCGYSEGTAEVPCGHVHNESCGYAEAVAGTPCANAETDPECDHSGDCGYVAAVEGQPCGHTACDDTCGYAPATEGTPCTHVCEVKVDSADSCYKLLCSHADGGHDEACGYAEAVEAHECHYECAECADSNVIANQSADWCGNPLCSQEDNAHVTSCTQYVAPENPQCFCTEKCTALNEWCDVCGFDYTKCGGTDTAAVYADGTIDLSQYSAGDTINITQDSVIIGDGNEYKVSLNIAENATVTFDIGTSGVKLGAPITVADGKTLTLLVAGDAEHTVNGGISLGNGSNVIIEGDLTKENNKLTVTATDGNAGIGANGGVTAGDITIRNARVDATGSSKEVSADSNKGIKADTSISGAAIGTSDGSMGDILIENSIIVAEGGYYESTSHAAAIGIGYVGSTMGDIILKNSQITARNNGDGLASVIGAGANMHVYVTGTLGDIVITNTELNLSMEIGTKNYYAAMIGSGIGHDPSWVNMGKIIFTDITQAELDEIIPIWLPSDFNQYGAYALGRGYAGEYNQHDAFGGVWVSDGNGGTVQIGDESGYYIACKNGGFVHDFDEICGGTCSDCGVTYLVVHTMGTAATCTELAVCSVCGESYGEVGGHTPDAAGYTDNGDGTHSYTCTVCGTVTEDHTGGTATSCTTQANCEYCGASYGEVDATNHDETVAFDSNGFCPNGCYEPAADSNADGVYEIANAGQLYWFAAQVNSGEKSINAVLMNDIDLTNHIWTPIGVTTMGEGVTDGYTGTFDGQGHVISNITFAAPVSAMAAGIFGTVQSGGTVKNLGVENLTFDNNDYDHRAGGIAGQLLADSTISDCYVINSTVKASSRVVGGIVGMNRGTVKNCYTCNVTLAAYNNRFGGISGDYSGGKLENCYTDYSALASSQAGTATNCEAGVSAERFASGEIAYALGDSWGQTIGTDGCPVYGGATVYQVANTGCPAQGEYVYSNVNEAVAAAHKYTNGFCACGEYEEAVQNADGYYVIDNAGKLFWFAQQVNSGSTAINGELTTDIVVNENVLTADGSLNGDGSNFRAWTPIGNNSYRYTGEFRGNEHTVSGLYFNGSANYVGLFGYVGNDDTVQVGSDGTVLVGSGGTVQNVGVIDSYLDGGSYVGGVVGYNDISGTVQYVYNTGNIQGSSQYVGGVVGRNQYIVRYAYNTGTVFAQNYAGGVVGHNNYILEYAYNTGSASDWYNYYVGVTGYNRDSTKLKNCYYLADSETDELDGTTAKTAGQFASGEVAYLLGSPFGQTIGTGTYPGFTGGTVYHGNCGGGVPYSNDAEEVMNHNCNAENGYRCSNTLLSGGVCNVYESASQNAEGYYEIYNASQLYWFAEQVNGGAKSINAVLMNDIDLTNHIWTPIGVTAMGESVTDGYTGTFDGQGHVISNIMFAAPTSAMAAGIFGTVQSGGTVKNLGVENLTFDNNDHDHRAGGIAGQLLADSTISDCYVINSTVKASSRVVGGIVGMNRGTVKNCYTCNMTLAGYSNRFGGISGDYSGGKLENCYTDYSALASSEAGTATNCEAGVSAERFASGEIAYALGDSWGQTIGTDGCPVYGGETVYQVVNIGCPAQGEYVYSNVNEAVAAAHKYTNGFCACGEYEEAVQNADGYYVIDNAGKLFWFAELVNGGNNTINAVLTADIDLENRNWTPIGTQNESVSPNVKVPYMGVFDGQCHVIKNLSIHVIDGREAGLFGRAQDATLLNFGVVDATVVSDPVNGTGYRAGIVAGELHRCTVANVYSAGNLTVTTTHAQAGGIAGECADSTLTNCFTTYGCLTASNAALPTAVTNCYYLASSANADSAGTFKTGEQFESGEVAYLMGDAYGQTIGTDVTPNFNGAAVYYGYLSCADDAQPVYSNNGQASEEKPDHAGALTYENNTADGTHIGTYTCCGSTFTEEHTEGTAATCVSNPICSVCKYEYGEPSNSAHVFADDNETCKYCQQIIVAKVNWDGIVSYYTDIQYVPRNPDKSIYVVLTLLDNYTVTVNKRLQYVFLERESDDITITVPNGLFLSVNKYVDWIDCEGLFDETGRWGNEVFYGAFYPTRGVSQTNLRKDLTTDSISRSGGSMFVEDGATLTLTGASSMSTNLYVNGKLVLAENATLRNTGTTYLNNDIYQSVDDIPAGLTGGSVRIKGITYTYVSGGSTDEKDHVPYWSCNSHVCQDSKVDCITRDHCDHCGDAFGEFGGHTIDITTGSCVLCSEYIAVATVTDGTTTLHADTGENLSTAIKQLMDGGSRTITVDLPGYDMITDVCSAVSDASAGEVRTVHLTVKGLTMIGEDTGFAGMTQLATLSLPDVTYLYEYALLYTELERLELTAEEEITVEREAIDSNIVGLVDLVLCCNKADEVSDGVYWKGFTFKSVTFTEHDYVDGVCTVCGTICDHSGSQHTTAVDNEDGTHSFTCSVCGETAKASHTYDNGFCFCGAYEPAVLMDGVYQISNAGQLYWFAAQVNGGNTAINAILTKAITVNENVLNEDGTLNGDGSNFRVWTPIGNYDYQYTGTFNGNGKTVSGLYFNDRSASNVGLFGYVSSGTIKHVGVINSYFNGYEYVGGVAGLSGGIVKNCYNTSTVSGDFAGGLVGISFGTAENCYNTGTVSGDTKVEGIVGSPLGKVVNCFNLDTCELTYVGTNKTAEQFASGEVAYLLNGSTSEGTLIWGQTIGTDEYPVLGGAKVYPIYNCSGELSGYTNTQTSGQPQHTHGTPAYTWTEDPTTLTVTVSCTACGETFTGSTTDMDSIVTSDDGFTTTYTATVTLDGKDYTDSKVVSNEVTSVNITWGEMDFTYTDESGWNNPDTAWVQVANTGNTSVSVTFTYDTERTDITGSFFDGTATVTAPVAINTESTKKIWLRLDGTPSEALNNTTIGSVKLTIE